MGEYHSSYLSLTVQLSPRTPAKYICDSLDLTMASRVHIIEPGWNPMLEQQALQRVHRLGQTRSVKQIRYIVDGADSVERVSVGCD